MFTGENSKPLLERVLYLMTHENTTLEDYCRKFEVSCRTFYRDREFIQNRLWNYKVIQIN